MTALTDEMQKQQLQELLDKTESFQTKFDRELAEAVLEVAIKANWQTAQELRGDGNMCQALMELMEPEINKIKENVREETTQQVTQQGNQECHHRFARMWKWRYRNKECDHEGVWALIK